MAEDCLILNIFAPSQTVITEQGAVPVMVFIHGELLAHIQNNWSRWLVLQRNSKCL